MELPKLKSCPFCGGTDHLFLAPDETGSGGQWVGPMYAGCSQIGGCGVSRVGDDIAEAIAAWNTRAADPCGSDGTATAAQCEDIAVPQDCQARAESIARKLPETPHGMH